MSDTPFAVTACLETGVVLSDSAYLTLDALLAAMIFVATDGDVSRAHGDIPLRRTGAVWCGSAAFLDAVARTSFSPAFKSSLSPREEMWLPPNVWQGKVAKKPRLGRVDQKRGRYNATMDQYVAIHADTATWYGRGDLAAVRELLADLRSIGKKFRQGWGRVSRVEVVEADDDRSLEYVDDAGTRHPMRPIPVTQWGDPSGCLVRGVVPDPPYFDATREVVCVVPSSRVAPWAGRFA